MDFQILEEAREDKKSPWPLRARRPRRGPTVNTRNALARASYDILLIVPRWYPTRCAAPRARSARLHVPSSIVCLVDDEDVVRRRRDRAANIARRSRGTLLSTSRVENFVDARQAPSGLSRGHRYRSSSSSGPSHELLSRSSPRFCNSSGLTRLVLRLIICINVRTGRDAASREGDSSSVRLHLSLFHPAFAFL